MERRNTPRGKHLPAGVTRRQILQFGAAGLGMSLLGPLGSRLPVASAAPIAQPFLVVIYLFGGNDGTNTVVPTTLGNYYTRRGDLAISAGTELSLNAGPNATASYGLHPSLKNLQSLWNDGDAALVNLVGYPTANLSHFTSQDIYSFGVRGEFADLGLDESGWVARFADLYAPTALGAVSVGLGRPLDFVGGTSSPFLVQSLSPFKFATDPHHRNNHPHRMEAVQDLLDGYARTGTTGDVANALDQAHELADQVQDAVASYSSTATYEASNGLTYNIHRTLQDIARLAQYGFETRIFYTGFGGFDTHSNQGTDDGLHASLLDRLDTALAAFVQDLKAMLVWDKATIVVLSEFGRRNYINGSGGTDHGGGNVAVVLGGGVNGGMYGRDLTTADLDAEYLGYDVDFRDIYKEILADHLGTDPAPVFPETQEKNTVLGLV